MGFLTNISVNTLHKVDDDDDDDNTVIIVIIVYNILYIVQGASNMTGTNCDLFTHKSSRSYLNHLVYI
jgi:hypothetical protein